MFYNFIWYLFQYQQTGNHNECDLMEESVYPKTDSAVKIYSKLHIIIKIKHQMVLLLYWQKTFSLCFMSL